MATQIKQTRDDVSGHTTLRVSGEMFREDALLLVRIAEEVRDGSGDEVTLDLADLALLDSDAAHVLRGLSQERGFDLTGTEILVQTAINEAERHRN